MSNDGRIDYSGYSYRELLEALNNINSKKYPRNYANLQAALEKIGPAQRDALAQGIPPDPLPDDKGPVFKSEADDVQSDPDVRRINHLVTAIAVAGISAYLLWVNDVTLPFGEPLTISLSGIGETLGYLAFLFAVAVPAVFALDYVDHRDNGKTYLLFAMFAESIAVCLIIFASVINASPA